MRTEIAVKQINEIYDAFLAANEQRINALKEEQLLLQREEESKSAAGGRAPIKVVLSLAEKIKKTALNTGIRFNIVDHLGYDNASLAMFQEAQKQGLSPDE